MNSTDKPARLAASLIFTEKNRSLTTARTFLLPCLCIEFSYNDSPSEKLQVGLVFLSRLKTGRKVHLTRFERGRARRAAPLIRMSRGKTKDHSTPRRRDAENTIKFGSIIFRRTGHQNA